MFYVLIEKKQVSVLACMLACYGYVFLSLYKFIYGSVTSSPHQLFMWEDFISKVIVKLSQ